MIANLCRNAISSSFIMHERARGEIPILKRFQIIRCYRRCTGMKYEHFYLDHSNYSPGAAHRAEGSGAEQAAAADPLQSLSRAQKDKHNRRTGGLLFTLQLGCNGWHEQQAQPSTVPKVPDFKHSKIQCPFNITEITHRRELSQQASLCFCRHVRNVVKNTIYVYSIVYVSQCFLCFL